MKKENFLKNLRKHNPKALDYVFDNYGNLIFKVAYSVLNNRGLSEECVNDVLFKIWNNIDSFKLEDDKFKSWIIIITKYTAIDMLRKEKKHDNDISIEFYDKEDDKFYGGNKYCSTSSGIFGIKGLAITKIDNLKFNEVKDAKDITLIVYEAKYTQDELFEIGIDDGVKSDKIMEQGISYVKEYRFKGGTVGLFYGLERTNDTIKVHYKGKESNIVLLSQNLRIYSDKSMGEYYYPTIYKDLGLKDEFIIEFKNIPQEDMSLNMAYGFNIHNDYTLIGEYKIK